MPAERKPPRRTRARRPGPSPAAQPAATHGTPGTLAATPRADASRRAAPPARGRIPLYRPLLEDAEVDAAARAIRSGWVTQGPEVAAFEREFAAAVGAPHACAVASGTAALHLSLLVAGVQPADDVVTVSHSFIATAASVRLCGARPVFVDVDPATFNIDPGRIEAAITPRTRAVLCVHQSGMPCDVRAIVRLARARGLTVVEDAACAIGSEISWDGRWQPIGRPHGDLACFSFHPRKLVTTGEGGMITTARADWADRLRLLRAQGMSVPPDVRHAASGVVVEEYPCAGYTYRMSDVQAAIGRQQLTRLAAIVARRRALAQRYRELLASVPGVTAPAEPTWARSNWQSYCVRLADGIDQRRVLDRMLEAGVATKPGVMCAHRERAFPRDVWSCGIDPRECGCAEGSCARLAESERARDRGVMLPLFHDMTDREQRTVVAALARACAD